MKTVYIVLTTGAVFCLQVAEADIEALKQDWTALKDGFVTIAGIKKSATASIHVELSVQLQMIAALEVSA